MKEVGMQTQSSTGPRFGSKRRRIALLAGAVVLLVMIGKYLASPLPRGAYPILSTAGWAGQLNHPSSHVWLPNGDLAFLQNDAGGMSQVCYQRMDAARPIGPIRRGPELPLNNRFPVFIPSPDEQWVAYMQLTPPGKFQTFVLSSDGKTTHQAGEYFSGWLGDSRSYLCRSIQTTGTKVYHVDSPTTETIPGVASWDAPTPLTTCATGTSFLIGGSFFNPIQNAGKPQNYPSMTLRSFSVANPKTLERQWQATVPPNMQFGLAYVSPDNRHLLWYTAKLADSRWSKWLARLNPKWNKGATFEPHYFLSDLNGNHMHPALTNIMGGTVNLNPQWTPDSKHVSFVYNNQLYLVPVD